VNLLNHWATTIVATIAVVLLGATVSGVLELGPTSSYVVMTVILGVFLIFHDKSFAYKSLSASALSVTKFTTQHVSIGAATAVGCLIFVGSIGLLIGAHFELVQLVSIPVSTIVLIFFAATFEEFLFRGPIFKALGIRFGSNVAIISTSVLFGIAHMFNPSGGLLAIVNVTLAGVLLGAAVAKTKTLWYSLSFHIIWNLLVALFFGAVSGLSFPIAYYTFNTSAVSPEMQWLLGSTFGIESGFVTTLCLSASIAFILVKVKTDVYVQAAIFRALYEKY